MQVQQIQLCVDRGIPIPAVAAFVRTASSGIAPRGKDFGIGVLVLGAGLVAERTPPERVRLAHVHPGVLQKLFGRLHDGLERAWNRESFGADGTVSTWNFLNANHESRQQRKTRFVEDSSSTI